MTPDENSALFQRICENVALSVSKDEEKGKVYETVLKTLKSRQNLSSEIRIEQIKEALSVGLDNSWKIAEVLGLLESSVACYAHDVGLHLCRTVPDKINDKTKAKKRPEIDSLVELGLLSIAEISSRLNLSSELISKYLFNTGQRDEYHKNRELNKAAAKELNKNKELVLNQLQVTLVEILKQKCRQQDDLALEKTVEFYFNKIRRRRNCNVPFENIHELFELYFSAKKENKKYTLWGLGAKVGIAGTTVSRIINAVGLEPLCWKVDSLNRTSPRLSGEKYLILEQARNLELSYADLAYFLGLNPTTTQSHMKKCETRHPYYCAVRFQRYTLSYRAASKIYELLDSGKSCDEIHNKNKISVHVLDYVIENRSVVGGKIIAALDRLYPEEKHSKPYLTK